MSKNKIEIEGKQYGVYVDFETYELYGELMGYKEFDEVINSLTCLYTEDETTKKTGLTIGALHKLSTFLYAGIKVYADYNNIQLDFDQRKIKRIVAANFEKMISDIVNLLAEGVSVKDEDDAKKKTDKPTNES